MTSEPLDKSVLDVSKLDFDNVAQVKNTRSPIMVAYGLAGLMRLEMFRKKSKI